MCRASSPRAELEASDPSRRRGPPGRQPVGVRHWEQEAVRRQTAAQAAPKHGSPSCRTASTRAYATGRCRRRGWRAARRRPRSWALAHQSAVPHASWWSWPERPPSFDAWYGIGEGWDVHAHPPSVGRSLWSSNPVREGHRSLGTGASRTWRLGLWPKPSGATPDLLVDARTPEPAAGKRGDPPPRSGAQTAFPRRDNWPGATPRGRGQGCENTPGPEPAPGPRPGGSLPSTSVLPSAAQAAGWQRPQLQAPARDSRIRRLRIFTGAMRASTPNVSCTLQYGTRRGLLIGSVPPRAEPSARCRCVASAPALPACAPASSARRCASSRPASLRTPSGPGHPP